jgi:hypothetical protein
MLVNTLYNPILQKLAGFENQVGLQIDMGGLHNHPFYLSPIALPDD